MTLKNVTYYYYILLLFNNISAILVEKLSLLKRKSPNYNCNRQTLLHKIVEYSSNVQESKSPLKS